MCLIIYNPEGKWLPKTWIENAYEVNSDGFGIMWPENGKINVIKGMMNFDRIWSILSGMRGKKYACHFRYRTHGKKAQEQCHPHKIIKNKVYMMHNGVFDEFPYDPVKSDTMFFAAAIRREVYSGKFNYNDLFANDVIKSFEESVGSNKLLFMANDGQTAIINEKIGSWQDGSWYSNIHSTIKRETRYVTKFLPPANPVTQTNSIAKNKAKIIVARKREDWFGQKQTETLIETSTIKDVAADDDDSEFLAAWLQNKEERDRRRNKMIVKKSRQGG